MDDIDYDFSSEIIPRITGYFEDEEKAKEVISLYRQGYSAPEIKEITNAPIAIRSIQRFLKKVGVIRPVRDALDMVHDKRIKLIREYWAINRKRDKFSRKKTPPGVRYKVLKRDGFKCVLCGATAKDSLIQVDHIVPQADGGTHDIENLRTLCWECNVGRNGVDY